MQACWPIQKTTYPLTRYIGAAIVLLLTFTILFRIPSASVRFVSGDTFHSTGSTKPVKHTSIHNATLGFEKILAINLPERTDHRDGLVLASSVQDIKINFIAGVHGDTVLDKVLPPKHADNLSPGLKGSWRAHMNAISHVLEHNLSSALIIEDDIDWDVRLKDQLEDFALASQHISSTSHNSGTTTFVNLANAKSSASSPYGDGWDVLWLGHCGMELPQDPDATMVLHEDDATVAEIQHQRSWDEKGVSPLRAYPEHTRIIAEQRQGTCSLAYAVSQQGARKILFALGLRRLDMAFDLMLREWCQEAGLGGAPMCIGVHPQLFDHHRRRGPNEIDSDISAPNGKYREDAYTLNIRWSVRMNMEKLLMGVLPYNDQWPDS